MGLAGAFGNQNYVCKACGHTMPEYAPHCPGCLNKMTRIQTQADRQPGPSQTSNTVPTYEESASSPGVPLGIIAGILLVLAVAAYSVFFAPKQAPAPVQTAAPPTRKVEPVRTVKRVKRPAVAQTATKRSSSAPRKATVPMKLWTVTDDDSD